MIVFSSKLAGFAKVPGPRICNLPLLPLLPLTCCMSTDLETRGGMGHEQGRDKGLRKMARVTDRSRQRDQPEQREWLPKGGIW